MLLRNRHFLLSSQLAFYLFSKDYDDSVTRWMNYLFQFWPLLSMKVCPMAKKLCQKWFVNLPKLKNRCRNSQSILKCCQSDKMSPNLVTLDVNVNGNDARKRAGMQPTSLSSSLDIRSFYLYFDVHIIHLFYEAILLFFSLGRSLIFFPNQHT